MTEADTAVAQFACTSCHAAIAAPCVTAKGKPTTPHAPRLRDARAWLKGAASRQGEVDGLTNDLSTADDALHESETQRVTAQDVQAALVRDLRAEVAELEARVAALTPEPVDPPVVVTPAKWDPTQITDAPRPSGSKYVRIEDIPGAGSDLRFAAAHKLADGKVITLPPNATTSLVDFAQGDGKKFMHGLMVNPSVGAYHCRGIVGTDETTVIQMAPNSSRFTMTTGASPTEATTQFVQNTILFYGIPDVEFGNLTLQGTDQPHFHHGFRSTGDRTHVHHLKTMGAAKSGQNMPPGETYSVAVGGVDALIEESEFDGRRTVGGPPVSSTVVATLAATNPVIRRCHAHDLLSGFGVVQWMGSGLTTEDYWVERPGTGTSGWNGAHTNHERAGGKIRHIRPHITLDGYWGSPQRNKSKFPHFIFLGPAGDYSDVEITDPVFDQWGATKDGFAVMMDDTSADRPKVTIGGKTLTGVVRPKWWLEQPAIDTSSQYWIGANSGDGSVWG